MDVQIALGADIAMAFDECTEYPAERGRAEESLRLTMAWARRSLDHFKAHRDEVVWREELGGQTQNLFGIVQGGMYTDLRKASAERLVEMEFDGYAIGGLSVGEPRALTLEMIAEVLPLLPKDKPRYVMGVGYPDEIEQYARMGVDMMDCVLPTRAARHGLLFTSEGRLNIKARRYAEDQGPPDPAVQLRGMPALLPRVSSPSDAGRRGAVGDAEHDPQPRVLPWRHGAGSAGPGSGANGFLSLG